MTSRIDSSAGENLMGRKCKDPVIGRQSGTEIQQLSRRTKTKSRRKPIPKRKARGSEFPSRNSLVNHGAATNAPKVINPRTSFWTVKLDTDGH